LTFWRFTNRIIIIIIIIIIAVCHYVAQVVVINRTCYTRLAAVRSRTATLGKAFTHLPVIEMYNLVPAKRR